MSINTIALSAKSFKGKARTLEQELKAYGGKFTSATVSPREIVGHSFWGGHLLFPGDFDQQRFQADKDAGVEDVQPYTDKDGIPHTPTARQYAYLSGIQLLVIDWDNKGGRDIPVGTPRDSIKYLLTQHPELVGMVFALYPSSSYTTESPRMHGLLALSEVVTDPSEYAELYARFTTWLGIEPDMAMARATQPLYGTVFDTGDYAGKSVDDSMLYFDPEAVLDVSWLRSLPPTPKSIQQKERKEQIARMPNGVQPESTPEEQAEAVRLATIILDSEQGKPSLKHSDLAQVFYALARVLGADAAYEFLNAHAIAQTAYAERSTWDRMAGLLEWGENNSNATLGTLRHYSQRSTPEPDGRVYDEQAKGEWKNWKRSTNKHDKGLLWGRVILDHYVRNGQGMGEATWSKFLSAYYDFTEGSEEALHRLTAHKYGVPAIDWKAGDTDGWYLLRLARALGVFKYNPTDITMPDIIVDDLSNLPTGSYSLMADTAIGKTAAQERDIAAVLERGGRVVMVVNTKTLAVTAAGRFEKYNPTPYLENGKRQDIDLLKNSRFLIVVAQTFARWVMTSIEDARATDLVIFDEMAQIVKSAYRKHYDHGVWSDQQERELDRAIRLLRDAGTTVRVMDAGLTLQTVNLFPDIDLIVCTQKRARAPMTIYNSDAALVALLKQQRDGLTAIVADTQAEAEACEVTIRENVPDARVLRVDGTTNDPSRPTHVPDVLTFMHDPDKVAPLYTHIIISPAGLSGLSVQYPAEILLQFCTYLTPSDNLQLLNRFRCVGSVHTYYSNSRLLADITTPKEALARAMLLTSGAMPEPTKAAMDMERIRYLGELDELYQWLSPRDAYQAKVEQEGRAVLVEWRESAKRALEAGEDADYTDYEDEHWRDQPKEASADMTNEDYAAWLNKVHIVGVVGEAAMEVDIAGDAVELSQKARGHKRSDVTALARVAGVQSVARSELALVLTTNVPPSHYKGLEARVALLLAVGLLGYNGTTENIPAEAWRENGIQAWEFLNMQRELWDKSVPKDKRWERLNDRTDKLTALRVAVKHMLGDWFGLSVTKGDKTRVLNPETDARLYDLKVEGMRDLYDLLYIAEHSARKLGRREASIVRLSSVAFPELTQRAQEETTADAITWFAGQSEQTQARFLQELPYNPPVDLIHAMNAYSRLDLRRRGFVDEIEMKENVSFVMAVEYVGDNKPLPLPVELYPVGL